MKRTVRAAAAAALTGLLALAAPAAAAPKTLSYRFGPVTVGPYQVKQNDLDIDIPKPSEDGYITGMDVDIVDAGGKPVPINRLMLHHIVFSNAGTRFGEKHDRTCNSITALDSKTRLPALVERFYAAGEERGKLRLPPGYGYEMKGKDRWLMTWMLMNHRSRTDRAYIEYRVTYDTARLKPVTPYWLDVNNCRADPVFDVPGGRRRGATYRRSSTWTVPEPGRILAAGGHVHGGAKRLTLNRTSCRLFSSRPTWGLRSHPFYNVKPVLHEPGPINMSAFTSATGLPLRRGERIRLDADYDGELMHTRVMGIMIAYFAPDAAARGSDCARSADFRVWRTSDKGRSRAPRFTVPLTGLRNGQARAIEAPPGARRRLHGGATIPVRDRYFTRPNVSVAPGSVLNWRFETNELHDVTVASGPRGFSSVHLSGGRSYRRRLRAPGTYKLFCALHPVEMTATVKVTGRKRR